MYLRRLESMGEARSWLMQELKDLQEKSRFVSPVANNNSSNASTTTTQTTQQNVGAATTATAAALPTPRQLPDTTTADTPPTGDTGEGDGAEEAPEPEEQDNPVQPPSPPKKKVAFTGLCSSPEERKDAADDARPATKTRLMTSFANSIAQQYDKKSRTAEAQLESAFAKLVDLAFYPRGNVAKDPGFHAALIIFNELKDIPPGGGVPSNCPSLCRRPKPKVTVYGRNKTHFRKVIKAFSIAYGKGKENHPEYDRETIFADEADQKVATTIDRKVEKTKLDRSGPPQFYDENPPTPDANKNNSNRATETTTENYK